MDPVQLKVIKALVQGVTVTRAAKLAGIHRNTIYNWQQQPAFAAALRKARNDLASSMRTELSGIAQLALGKLRHILQSPATPPSVRLRAALAVLRDATAPEPRPVDEILAALHADDAAYDAEYEARAAHRGELPCPCGSGAKYKVCCATGAPSERGAAA